MESSLFTILPALCLVVPAIAEPGTNIDGDDGGTGSGTEMTKWGYYLQGVRVSVYRISTHRILATADYSNMTNDQIKSYDNGSSVAAYWFGYTPKTAYMKGTDLTISSADYSVKNFKSGDGSAMSFPNCITQDDRSNYKAVKEFFCDKSTIEGLAADFGMAYDDMVTEDIKLIIEPVAYVKYEGSWYAMTVTAICYGLFLPQRPFFVLL